MKKIYFVLFITSILLGCSKESDSDSQNTEPEVLINKFEVTITASEGGTVNVSSGSYEEGTVLTITASPGENYVFSGWEGFESTDPTITINVNQIYNLKAIFILEEEAPLDQNSFTENVVVEGSQKFQGTPTPNSNISFTMENSENVLAVVENGFNIDLNVPNEVEGAYLQFLNTDKESADSFLSIPRNNSSKKVAKTRNKFFSKKNRKYSSQKKNNNLFNISVDFNQNITAGKICLNIYVYESNNISFPIELCITINNFGGGPSNLTGKWEYYKEGIEGSLEDWYYVDTEPDGYYNSNGNFVEIPGCYYPACSVETCINYNTTPIQYFGYTKFSNMEHFDYIILNEDGTYSDNYDKTISEAPEIVDSIDECVDDPDYPEFKYSKNFYPTTVTQKYTGKWSYDEATSSIGIFDYSDQIVDSEGTIFDTPVDIYDEPYPYYDNGTFVEINGDEMILKYKDYYGDVYVTVFRRINP